MRRLGHNVSLQTVRYVLVASGQTSDPNDHPHNWSNFLKRHAKTLLQRDLAHKKKWNVTGIVDVYFCLVFLHLGSRRNWISPSTDNPTGDWTNVSVQLLKEQRFLPRVPCCLATQVIIEFKVSGDSILRSMQMAPAPTVRRTRMSYEPPSGLVDGTRSTLRCRSWGARFYFQW